MTSSEPIDWETEAILPARLLAGTPPAVQARARRLERCLYLWILERLEPEPEAPALPEEMQALLTEVSLIVRSLRDLGTPESVTAGLDAALTVTRSLLEPLTGLQMMAPESGVRPFALHLSREALFLDTLHAFGAFIATVRTEPSRGEQFAALYRDLLWILAVLKNHIARRGEISCLRQGDSRFCSVAGFLAERLEGPAAALREALEAPVEAKA